MCLRKCGETLECLKRREVRGCSGGGPGPDLCFPNAHLSEPVLVLLWAFAQAVPNPPLRMLFPPPHPTPQVR